MKKTLKLPDGIYFGHVNKKNKPCKTGTLTYPDRSKYIGQFKNGKPHGKGKIVQPYKSPLRMTNTGTFKNGYFITGKTEYYWGEKYFGPLDKEERRHGKGKFFFFKDRHRRVKYVGEFKRGKMMGKGTVTYNDGKVEKGIWDEDRFINKSIKLVTLRIKRQMTWLPEYLNFPKSLLKKNPELKKFPNLVPNYNFYFTREHKFEFNKKSKTLRCLSLGVEPIVYGIYKKVIKLKPRENSSNIYCFTTKTPRPVLKMSINFLVTNNITFIENKGFVFINEVKIFVVPKNEKKSILCGKTTIWMDDGDKFK